MGARDGPVGIRMGRSCVSHGTKKNDSYPYGAPIKKGKGMRCVIQKESNSSIEHIRRYLECSNLLPDHRSFPTAIIVDRPMVDACPEV